MKRPYFILIVLVLFACERNKRFEISGNIENADADRVYLERVVLSESEILDSVRLKKSGAFKIKGKTDHTGFYQLRINNKIVTLVIEPGEQVTFEADYTQLPVNYEVNGSNGSLLVQKLNREMYETKAKLDTLEQLYKQSLEENPDDPMLDSLSVKYDEVINDQKRHNIVFILNFYDNLASLYALYQKIDDQTLLFNKTRDIQYYKILSDSLGKYHPDAPQVKALQNNTKDLVASLNKKRAIKLTEGVEPSVPEIALPNVHQDTVRLSALKGKVVLLSFWASWHKRSVEESIKLIDLYEKYHGQGFEIYQVSLDKSYDNWVGSIRFNELPWINVSDLSYPNSYTAKIYNVQQLPTHYLLNPKQDEILGRNLSVHELDRKISSMLN